MRLHIRANSNGEGDQAIKLTVRDRVNEYLYDTVKKSSFEEAYADIRLRLPAIKSIAERTLKEGGYSYGAAAELRREYFPTRRYGDTTVPAGEYDALVIELGQARGDNWWCVVYPPMCYGDKFEYKSFFAELFAQ